MIDKYATGCSCLWSFANFCRTKIAQEGEHVAPKLSQLCLKISLSSSVHRKRRQSWSCGLMPLCMNIASTFAVVATEYCLKRRRRPCRLQSRSGPVSRASFSEIPLYLEAVFVTLRILSGFCLLITG